VIVILRGIVEDVSKFHYTETTGRDIDLSRDEVIQDNRKSSCIVSLQLYQDQPANARKTCVIQIQSAQKTSKHCKHESSPK